MSTLDDFETMHPGVDPDPDFAAPGIAAIELATADIARTADCLRRRQVGFITLPDGRLAVPAREANGTILFFVEG